MSYNKKPGRCMTRALARNNPDIARYPNVNGARKKADLLGALVTIENHEARWPTESLATVRHQNYHQISS